MSLSTLSEWLTWITSVHKSEIELGLKRVKTVASRLDLLSPKQPVIIVGGTNGKGSTVAGLAAIYQAAQFRVGTFTSPYLFKHNELVRVNGRLASDEEYCQAYAAIDATRENISLTPFEFNALAALMIFKAHPLDVLILEVGLGGRLDAVNIIDADLAIVTSIALDHVDRLGNTREAIGFEKAGIFRKGKPAICGDFNPPQSLLDHAKHCNTLLFEQGKAFFYLENEENWSWYHQRLEYEHLPLTPLATQNMSTVLMGISLLQARLPVTIQAIKKGLKNIQLPARQQIIPGNVMEMFDVSHNPAACAWLANKLRSIHFQGKIHAVFSMLSDKDINTCIQSIREFIHAWYVAPLKTARGRSLANLRAIFQQEKVTTTHFFDDMSEAYIQALETAEPGDCVLVFGSFHTVDEATMDYPEKRERMISNFSMESVD